MDRHVAGHSREHQQQRQAHKLLRQTVCTAPARHKHSTQLQGILSDRPRTRSKQGLGGAGWTRSSPGSFLLNSICQAPHPAVGLTDGRRCHSVAWSSAAKLLAEKSKVNTLCPGRGSSSSPRQVCCPSSRPLELRETGQGAPPPGRRLQRRSSQHQARAGRKRCRAHLLFLGHAEGNRGQGQASGTKT